MFGLTLGAFSHDTIFLHQLPLNEILDDYAPPKRQSAFNGSTLNIGGKTYLNGLVTHAPTKLKLKAKRQVILFGSFVGVDFAALLYNTKENREKLYLTQREVIPKYAYDNKLNQDEFTLCGKVVFKVLGNGYKLFNSGKLKAGNQPLFLNIDISGFQKLILEADPTSDGSFAYYTNWANPYIIFERKDFFLYHEQEKIMVNHLGFHPESPKSIYCISKHFI